MPYTLTLEAGLVRITYTGVVTPHDLQSVAADLAELDRTLPVTPHRLSDHRQVEGNQLHYTDLRDFALQRRGAVLANPIKVAIVWTKTASLGYARMLQMVHTHPHIEIELFTSLAEAEAWLAAAGPNPPPTPAPGDPADSGPKPGVTKL